MLKDVTAVILSSGKATRLSSLNLNVPKSLIEFNNIPFLVYLIEWLKSYGIRKFVVTINAKDSEIYEKAVGKISGNVEVVFAKENTIKNTSASTYEGLKLVNTEQVLLIVADSLFGVNLNKMFQFHNDKQAKITSLVTDEVGLPAYPMKLVKDRLLFSNENLSNYKSVTTIGLYIANTKYLREKISPDTDIEINKEPLYRLEDSSFGYMIKGLYYDYGTPDRLEFLKQNPHLIKKTLSFNKKLKDDGILNVAKSIHRYCSTVSDSDINNKKRFLCENIIPGDVLAYSGKGIKLQTNKGDLYDLSGMSLNCILGQNDTWVNANLVSYILSGSPSFSSTRLANTLFLELAEKLSKISGIEDAVVDHRQCNGSDVTELAIVAAYRHKKENQKYVISFKGSYYGQNLTSYIVSDLQKHNRFFEELNVPVFFLDAPTHTDEGLGEDVLSSHDLNILENLDKIGHEAFAVIIEPVQVNNCVNVASRFFLKKLREKCESLSIPLIFDDIQTGFGWLGKLTSAEYFGVKPNMMAVSKALTSGYGPLSALIMERKYGDLPMSTVLKTNGADLRSLVAAKSVLERLVGVDKKDIPTKLNILYKKELEMGLLSQFEDKVNILKSTLQQLCSKYPSLIKRTRGIGLIRCLDLNATNNDCSEMVALKLQKSLLEKGVLVRNVKGSLLFKVPIVATSDHLGVATRIIENVFSDFSE